MAVFVHKYQFKPSVKFASTYFTLLYFIFIIYRLLYQRHKRRLITAWAELAEGGVERGGWLKSNIASENQTLECSNQ